LNALEVSSDFWGRATFGLDEFAAGHEVVEALRLDDLIDEEARFGDFRSLCGSGVVFDRHELDSLGGGVDWDRQNSGG